MKSFKNIVFLGMMGSGKTTVGKMISKKLNIDFFDVDQEIENKTKQSIKDIFEKKGEIFFRKLEEKITLAILRKNQGVISLGGGAFLNKNIQKEVLENWVDESRFYNFEKGSPQRYIYVGRLEPVKNPLRLLKAWKNINHKLDIYGDGSLKSKIIDFIKQNTLTDRVRLMGEEDDVKNIYANTSGVLISSDREGSPKVLFEALFCNIPVISTSVGIMPDLLPSACLSESNDESFKELLEFTIPKIDEIHESCTTLFNEAKTKYTLKNQNERVEEIYRTLLSNASR